MPRSSTPSSTPQSSPSWIACSNRLAQSLICRACICRTVTAARDVSGRAPSAAERAVPDGSRGERLEAACAPPSSVRPRAVPDAGPTLRARGLSASLDDCLKSALDEPVMASSMSSLAWRRRSSAAACWLLISGTCSRAAAGAVDGRALLRLAAADGEDARCDG